MDLTPYEATRIIGKLSLRVPHDWMQPESPVTVRDAAGRPLTRHLLRTEWSELVARLDGAPAGPWLEKICASGALYIVTDNPLCVRRGLPPCGTGELGKLALPAYRLGDATDDADIADAASHEFEGGLYIDAGQLERVAAAARSPAR